MARPAPSIVEVMARAAARPRGAEGQAVGPSPTSSPPPAAPAWLEPLLHPKPGLGPIGRAAVQALERWRNDPTGTWDEGPLVAVGPARARAKEAIDSAPSVPARHPYARHVADVRDRLAKKGLPTDARGVRVMIIGEHSASHGTRTARAAAGPLGLARGADVELSGSLDSTRGDPASNAARDRRYGELKQLEKSGKATTADLIERGAIRIDQSFDSARREIKDAKERHAVAGSKQTTVVSMSWGAKPWSTAEDLAGRVKWDSAAGKEAIAAWEKKTGERFDPKTKGHAAGARALLTETLAKGIADRVDRAGKTDAKQALEAEVADANKEGLVIFKSAGNDNLGGVAGVLRPRDPRTTRSSTDDIPGIITVGNADLGGPGPKDDRVHPSSSAGHVEIAAPGTNLPVGKVDGKYVDRTGTSYSAPYAASVAALMIKANPKITPAEIEKILTSPAVARDLPGDLDGAGLIDPVAAVERARALATSR